MRYRVFIPLLGGDGANTFIDAPNARVAIEWVLLGKQEDGAFDEFVPGLEQASTEAFVNDLATGEVTRFWVRARTETTLIAEAAQ